jgi:hypothetical protein
MLSADSDVWYLETKNTTYGPMSLHALQRYGREGFVRQSSLVKRGVDGDAIPTERLRQDYAVEVVRDLSIGRWDKFSDDVLDGSDEDCCAQCGEPAKGGDGLCISCHWEEQHPNEGWCLNGDRDHWQDVPGGYWDDLEDE